MKVDVHKMMGLIHELEIKYNIDGHNRKFNDLYIPSDDPKMQELRRVVGAVGTH